MTTAKQPYKDSPFAMGGVNRASFIIGAEAANIINVGIQFKDGAQDSIRACVMCYLSSDANGDSVVATAPTTVAIGTDGLLIPLVAGKAFMCTSESDGDVDINITLSAGAATYYLALVMPDGSLVVSGAITFAA